MKKDCCTDEYVCNYAFNNLMHSHRFVEAAKFLAYLITMARKDSYLLITFHICGC